MIPGLGHLAQLWIGIESSYGDGNVNPGNTLEIVSWNVQPTIGVIPDPSLYNKSSRRALYPGGFTVRGTFVVRLNYEGLLELFRGVFGAYSATLVGGETLVRDHVFKEGSTLPSYEIQISAGDIPTGKVFQLLGAKLINLTVRGTAGNGNDAMLLAEFTVLAKDMVSNFTGTGIGSFPNPLPVMFHECTTADDGTADASSNIRLRGIEVSLENPHTEDRYFFGSKNIDEPLRADFLTARFRLTQEFATKTQYDAARAFTNGSPQLIFKRAGTIGNASQREFELRANSANLVDYSAPIESYGIIISTATWEAFYNVGDASALVARMRSIETALP